MTRIRSRQRGVTLFFALIFLVLLTLLAVTTFNVGKSSMQIVGNFQHHNDVLAAAQEAIEEAISTTRLMLNPGGIYLVPGTANNTRCVDVNGDGVTDVNVTLTPTPTCVKAQAVKNRQLVITSPTSPDLACTVSPTPGSSGVPAIPSGNSFCADTIWEVSAVAADTVTQARTTVTEGVAVRVKTDTVATYCP
jgi:Tfp pilus assembly protein PilX